MSKIYVVKSSSGSYEDYRSWNEKAFTDKHKAEEYARMLDKAHEHKPEFITEDFQSNYSECCDNLPDWGDFPGPLITDDNRSEYTKWVNNNIEKDREIIINEMYKRGFFLTKNMIELYERWEDNHEDYHKCTVEELNLE